MDKKSVSVRASRKRTHDILRRSASTVVSTVSILQSNDRRARIPAMPEHYSLMLGTIEEYYNQLADEFDDIPGEPPLSSVDEAYAEVRKLHEAACRDPAAPFAPLVKIGEGLLAERKGPRRAKKLRNAGPNADSAGDLLGDAIGMLTEVKANAPKITVLDLEKRLEEVIGVLRELEEDEEEETRRDNARTALLEKMK